MAYVETIGKQKLMLSELDASQFPNKLRGKISYKTPMGQLTFDQISMDLKRSEFYLHPEHSFITNIITNDNDTIELVIHSDCLIMAHKIEVPKYIVEARTQLSWINWNTLGGAREIIRETQDSGQRGIVELFSWSSFVTEVVEDLLDGRENKENNDLWRILTNGQLVAVDYKHDCLIDLKHHADHHIDSAMAYYKNLQDWAYIVAAQGGRI